MPVELKRKEIFEHHFTGLPKYEGFKPGDKIYFQVLASGRGVNHSGIGYFLKNGKIRITHYGFNPEYNVKYRLHEKLARMSETRSIAETKRRKLIPSILISETTTTLKKLREGLKGRWPGHTVRIEKIEFKPEFKKKRKK